MANKTVMKLHMNDCYKCKKVALHSVTKIEGIDSLTINTKENTLTVIGDADPVCMSNLLRKKFRCAQLISVGPVSGGGGGEGVKGGGGKAGGGEGGKGGEAGGGKGGAESGGGKGGGGKGGEVKGGEGEGKGKAAESGKGGGGNGGGKGGEGKGKGKGGEGGAGKGGGGEVEEVKGGGGGKASSGGGGTELNVMCYHPPGHFCGPNCYQVCQGHCYPPCSSCSCRPERYQVCQGHCSPPCFSCSCRPEIVWPQYPQPCAHPDGVVYVLKEESYDPCTIM